MPFVRNKKTLQLDEISDEQAAQLREMGIPVFATAREAAAPAPQVGGWQKIAPGRPEAPAQGVPVMDVIFPRQQAAQRAGRGVLAGNVETAKDMITLPFRAAAGAGSYLGTLGSEAMDGGLASPQTFEQAKATAQHQAALDMANPGADINYPGWARGFVAPAQDPVAAALSLLPLGKPLGALGGRLGAIAAQGGRLAPAAEVGAEALNSPIGQGLGIGATGAGIGLGANALDRAVEPGQSVADVSPDELRSAALVTALGGGMGAAGAGAARAAGALAPRIESAAGRWIRKAIKPNGLDAQQALESALVEDRLLPELVGNRTITPGGIAERFQAKSDAISSQIGPALAEADKAGPIYSSAQALEAGRNALQGALRGKKIIITPRQSEAIINNMTESVQNQTPPAYGPWQSGRIAEAPLTASEAYATKKALQDWGYNRLDVDPLLPSRGRAEAAIGASRNINDQLWESAPAVKELDRQLAPYSAIRDVMETAAGPRENRFIGFPAFLGAAGHISGARQAWNTAQMLRAASQMQPAPPASTAVYLSQALQRRNTPQE